MHLGVRAPTIRMIGNVADEVQSDEAEDVDIDDDQPMDGWLQRIARVSASI